MTTVTDSTTSLETHPTRRIGRSDESSPRLEDRARYSSGVRQSSPGRNDPAEPILLWFDHDVARRTLDSFRRRSLSLETGDV
ncbi:hypothetical protein D8S78_07805 [Natrialba swarupiae]|nr:hypothetical protein [Natrialba swarupiae]